jgi:DNA-binding LytR/AlgR family response regulator
LNTKLKCLLLDDELPGLTYLKMLCEQIPELEVVKSFNRTDLFLSEMDKIDFDLCILDIEMPRMNGVEIARLLKDKLIIFTTAHKEYAAEAFDLDAIDYIRKPIQLERLQKAVSKALKHHSTVKHKRKFTHLNTDKGKSILYFDQICFIKTSNIDSRDKEALLRDGTKVQLKNISFEKLMSILPPFGFCQINKREVIAVDIVKHFNFDQITTTLKDENNQMRILYLTEVYRKNFLEKVKI